jgi:hypothetical protein
LLTGCSALALAACGGEEQQVDRRTQTGPTIDAGVAEPLAQRSDKVAALLDSGDTCAAREEAARLRADLTEAINADSIPELYLEELSGVVNELEAQIPPCQQPEPPPTESGKPDKKDKDKDKDKDKGHDDEGDD